MKRRGGIGPAMDVIEHLSKRGLFRARELNPYELSQNWLTVAQRSGLVRRHGHGVWGSASYQPTRYEIAQLRFPRAVFWGPSALWLHGALDAEPEPMWFAIASTSRASSKVGLDTVIIRTRQLERGLVTVQPAWHRIPLRVYDLERAHRDAASIDPYRFMERVVGTEPLLRSSQGLFSLRDDAAKHLAPHSGAARRMDDSRSPSAEVTIALGLNLHPRVVNVPAA